MATTFTAAQLEQFRRDAKRLGRQLSIRLSQAQDLIAVQHGFKNWSLLAKHREAVPAPKALRKAVEPAVDNRPRHYLHGDQDEDEPSKYYCARCDVFFEASHFNGWHKAERNDESDGERYLASLARWNTLPRSQKATRRRADDVPNILAERALAERDAYQTSRSPFHKWLEAQRDRDDPVGDLAGDAMRDKRFPVTASTRRQVQDYLSRRGADVDVLRALRDAWTEFSAPATA